MIQLAPNIDTASLLAHACESLASASLMVSDFAANLSGAQRRKAMSIQQIIMLAKLAVGRALERIDPV